MNFIKKLVAVAAIAAVAISPSLAQAAWITPDGLYSNVCVAPSGHYMVFTNNAGRVGTPCVFKFYNSPYVYHGVWQ